MKNRRATTVVLAIMCLMYFITYLDRVNVSTAGVVFGKELHFSHTQLGFVFSAFAYPYLAFQIIGGWIGDRFGPKRTLAICALIWAGATVLTGLAGGLVSMILARVLLGFGEGATFPVATCAMARWVPAAKRGFAQGITHSASRLGSAAAPAVVAWLITAYSWRVSFIAVGIFSFTWVLLWLFYFKDDPAAHPAITQEELAALPHRDPLAQRPAIPWGPLFKRIFPVSVVYFCYGWALWLFMSWIPSYFKHSYHLDLKHSALFSSGVFFAGMIGDTLGGVISDHLIKKTGRPRIARSAMIAVCMSCTLLSMVPMMFYHDLVISTLCLVSAAFFLELVIGPIWAVPMDIAPEFSGTASGMMNSGSALAAIISPVVGGILIDKTGNWDMPFIVSIFVLLAGVLLSFTMRPENRFAAPENAVGSRHGEVGAVAAK